MVAWPIEPEPECPSVLITDDNTAWRDAVDDVLAREGFHTLQATCGEEAIAVVRTERLDIVLTDFHMPRLDGLETLQIIRQEDHWLPAVIMTAHPTDLPLIKIRALRIQRILVKPANREQILRTVTSLVRPYGHPDDEPPADFT